MLLERKRHGIHAPAVVVVAPVDPACAYAGEASFAEISPST